MTIYEIISLIIASIAAIANIFLWVVTYRNLREFSNQNKKIYNSMKSEAVDKINGAHRELFFFILQDPELLKLFNSIDQTDDPTTKRNLVATLFFNHIRSIYTSYNKGFIDEDDWVGFQLDMISMFDSIDYFPERWKQVNQYYDTGFEYFLTTLVEHKRMYTRN